MPNQQSSTGQLYHPSAVNHPMSPFVSQPQNENQESNPPNLSYAMAFPGIREYYQVNLKGRVSDFNSRETIIFCTNSNSN